MKTVTDKQLRDALFRVRKFNTQKTVYNLLELIVGRLTAKPVKLSDCDNDCPACEYDLEH